MKTDLVAVKGKDPYASTLRAIQELGGIDAFVRRGDKVGSIGQLSFQEHRGLGQPRHCPCSNQQCLDGGAREIRYLSYPHPGILEEVTQAAVNSPTCSRV